MVVPFFLIGAASVLLPFLVMDLLCLIDGSASPDGVDSGSVPSDATYMSTKEKFNHKNLNN